MKKFLKLMVTVMAAVCMMSIASFAGEFIGSGSNVYYDTGEDNNLNGWHWIMRTDGLARCYYFTNGFLWIDSYTPDGYYVDNAGEWVQNGQVMTKYAWENGMELETNWYNFGGAYSVLTIYRADGTVEQYAPGQLVLSIIPDTYGCWLDYGSERQWFTSIEDGYYSFSAADGTLIDVINENYFRLISTDGEVCYLSK
ncbi:MAG: hypothetical protein K6A76_08330 [Oribacterium sp.]|nr:hypothetical protein [Oribacterium sp.]